MPKFNRRHYETIAEIIRTMGNESRDLYTSGFLSDLAFKTCEVFERDNPSFSRDRFVSACGLVLGTHPRSADRRGRSKVNAV